MSDRFDRFLPLAGVLAGLLFFAGSRLAVERSEQRDGGLRRPSAFWQDDRGQHQIVALLVAPFIAFLLVFFGAGLRRRLDAGHATPATDRSPSAARSSRAATFALVGMLEAAMTNAAHEGQREAVYTLNQLHSYDWLGWNAAFAAVLLATGLGARRNGMLPTPLAWVTIVIGASLLTPLGFFGFILLPVWLIAVGLWLFARPTTTSLAPI